MITREPTEELLREWRLIWLKYKDALRPNRKNGAEILAYLQSRYTLTEIYDEDVLSCISGQVEMNEHLSEKLPNGCGTVPRAFFLEDEGDGRRFYLPENRDEEGLWGDEIARILVGVELSSGSYLVEGSTMLWDELCAFQGVDEKDLQNWVIVAEYVNSLKRFGRLDEVLSI